MSFWQQSPPSTVAATKEKIYRKPLNKSNLHQLFPWRCCAPEREKLRRLQRTQQLSHDQGSTSTRITASVVVSDKPDGLWPDGARQHALLLQPSTERCRIPIITQPEDDDICLYSFEVDLRVRFGRNRLRKQPRIRVIV